MLRGSGIHLYYERQSGQVSVAMVYNNIGKLYQKKGDKQNALFYLEKARTIFENTLGKEHPNTKAVQKSIDKVTALPN